MPDDRFAPPSDDQHPELALDRPEPAPVPSAPAPTPEVAATSAAAEPEPPVAPGAPVPLRERPALRFGLAVGLGLAAGYLATVPHSSRAERRILATRADAARLAQDPEKRDLAPALLARADREAGEAASTDGIILVTVAAAIAGAWVWLTRN